MKTILFSFLFLLSVSAHAAVYSQYYLTRAEAQAGCSAVGGANCSENWTAISYCSGGSGWRSWAAINPDYYYFFGCDVAAPATCATVNVNTGECPPPPPSCTAGTRYSDVTLADSICVNGCTAARGAVGIALNGHPTSWGYTTTGASCGAGNSPTAQPAPASVPGTTDCSKLTKLNGGIEYDCGKSTSTGSATGVHCEQTASGYTCKGGDSGTTCWTDDTGTVNCTGKGATEEGVSTTTPTRTERSTKTDSTTGTRTETRTEYTPGGGWTTTTSTYDAAGTKTGETKESGSGLGGAKDGEGNDQGGDGDGTSEPPPEPPSGTLPNSNITLPGFQSSSFLSGSAGCPSPASFNAFGQTYAVSFEPGCQAAGMLRAILIVFALFLAVRIFQGYVTEAVR